MPNETVSADDIAEALTPRQKAALVKFAKTPGARTNFGTDLRSARMTKAEMAEIFTSRFALVQVLSEMTKPKFYRLSPIGAGVADFLAQASP